MKTIRQEEGYPLALFESYMALINGSIGSRMFRELYVRTPRGPTDVIMDGDLACAFFVSAVLTMFRLTKGGVHTTVSETVYDLESSGWTRLSATKPGAVIVWSSKIGEDNVPHRHIGFAVTKNQAISTISKKRCPDLHHMTFGEKEDAAHRSIETIYFHKKLQT